uniref:Carboxymethylenebutenolidase homolog n=1 Tax=Amphiprion percula TaxID=161767 RepID=A0A3P8U449_AMPPE
MGNEAKPCPCDIGDRMEYGRLGQEVQIEHINAYVVKPSTPSDKAIIVIHDIFGWQLPNTRYMADMLAANGYMYVESYTDSSIKEPWSPSHDWANFMEWLKDKKPTEINKEVDTVLRYLKEQCGAKHIGAVGFCWGGVATHYLALQYPQVKAGVSLYGIIRDTEDKYDLKSPTLFILGGNDDFIPAEQVSILKTNLKKKCKIDYQVKTFPDQSHGFVHRKREEINPADKPSIQEARMDMLNWLNKYM